MTGNMKYMLRDDYLWSLLCICRCILVCLYNSSPFNYHYFPQCLPKGVLNYTYSYINQNFPLLFHTFNSTVSSDGNRQVQLEFLPKAITVQMDFLVYTFCCRVSRRKLWCNAIYNFNVKCFAECFAIPLSILYYQSLPKF